MQHTPYAAMSDAIARYVSHEREKGIIAKHVAQAIEDALGAALGLHLEATVSISWKKGKEE